MMPEFIPILGILGLSYLSLALFALAKFGHFKDVFNRPPAQWQSRLLSLFAWLLLMFSLSACASDQGWAYGSILFMGIISLAAMLVILTLSYSPRHLPIGIVTGSVLTSSLLLSAGL
ncbi:DUF3325 domain-containing protein [Shewanella sp. CG12_big_fil_rev_8_21_14_0_65_47_15]|uniref:DUF3325 domain-containing protein n=1 Tax=Shewanella sp. CG12_big_fil_rev_8_21_14_0_65_47_15 TaxID=1975537 RepID=UPI000CBF0E2B|nr:DUF3325 domain-containing protein [Shewanella sp. CG12_big_fil_rev_8_21_14_0_65_47_15]PIW62407.1 MAG: DUF3325 domain-containing protein [Shewanella sp. CG12_big_fil_rev_8_21_14_0_65_47_15]